MIVQADYSELGFANSGFAQREGEIVASGKGYEQLTLLRLQILSAAIAIIS